MTPRRSSTCRGASAIHSRRLGILGFGWVGMLGSLYAVLGFGIDLLVKRWSVEHDAAPTAPGDLPGLLTSSSPPALLTTERGQTGWPMGRRVRVLRSTPAGWSRAKQ